MDENCPIEHNFLWKFLHYENHSLLMTFFSRSSRARRSEKNPLGSVDRTTLKKAFKKSYQHIKNLLAIWKYWAQLSSYLDPTRTITENQHPRMFNFNMMRLFMLPVVSVNKLQPIRLFKASFSAQQISSLTSLKADMLQSQ